MKQSNEKIKIMKLDLSPMKLDKMDKLKMQLLKNNYEYVVKKYEVIIYHDNLIVKVWNEEEEFFILTYDDQESALIDDFKEIYFKKKVKSTIKLINKLVTV
ncbi:hypothetical protein [Staphylococcus equorum]|uniref:hypothetical protein n=1 Tax=Staphylococcus equorum TaxID=246432 RepID=UPI003EB7EA45